MVDQTLRKPTTFVLLLYLVDLFVFSLFLSCLIFVFIGFVIQHYYWVPFILGSDR